MSISDKDITKVKKYLSTCYCKEFYKNTLASVPDGIKFGNYEHNDLRFCPVLLIPKHCKYLSIGFKFEAIN